MPRSFLLCLRFGLLLVAAPCLISACGWHHPHKIRTYDRSFTDDDSDPTFKSDPERADEEVIER